MCGVCSSRCPAGISHPEVAMLARRINGKYIAPEAKHLTERVEEVKKGDLLQDVRTLMDKSDEDIRALYNSREIEQ